jgi:NADPH2:quinone reductase
VRTLGATEVVDPDGVAAHGPYDVVLELVGGTSFDSSFAALAVEGRIVVIGVGGGGRVELSLLEMMGKRARVMGSTLRARNRREKAEVAYGVARHVVPLLASGRVQVPLSATFPMAQASAAYDAFAAGGKLGKIVLTA